MRISKYTGVLVASARLFLASTLGVILSLSPVFVSFAAAASPQAQTQQDANWEKEFTLWRKATKSGKREDYAAYLKAYPAGKFAKVAQSRVDGLVAKAVPETPAKEVVKVAAGADPVIPEAKPAIVKPVAQIAPVPKAPEVPQIAQKRAAPSEAADEVEPAPATSSAWEQEYALWKAAAQGNTVIEYETYLKSFPKGKFAAIAQSRITALSAAEKPVEGVSEGDDTAAPAEEAPSENADNAPVAEDATDDPVQQAQESQPVESNLAKRPAPRLEDNGATEEATQDNGRRRAPLMAGDEYSEDQALDREGHSEMQGRLSSLGFETGGADGVFGPRTRSAIAAWQEANGAPVSGYLGEDQIDVIRQQSEQAYSGWLSGHAGYDRPPLYRERRPVYEAEERVIIRNEPIYVSRPVIIERVHPRIIVRPGYVYRPFYTPRRPYYTPRRYVRGSVVVIGPRAYARKCRERDRRLDRCR